MRLSSVIVRGEPLVAVRRGDCLVDTRLLGPQFSRLGSLQALLEEGPGALAKLGALLSQAPRSALLEPGSVRYQPLLPQPGKVLCLGLNYIDHAAESPYERPAFPVVFTRVASSLLGHDEPLIIPRVSSELDYEAELAVVIGRPGRSIAREDSLTHVAGYSLFNDGSIRDYQFKSHQWAMGKNFDKTGGFGPELVTVDELPVGARGLRIQTRVDGEVLQDANTSDMIFDVADTIATLSLAMTLEPGDVIVMGTPGGVGFARRPQRFLRAGEEVAVTIERIGVLHNKVIREGEDVSRDSQKARN